MRKRIDLANAVWVQLLLLGKMADNSCGTRKMIPRSRSRPRPVNSVPFPNTIGSVATAVAIGSLSSSRRVKVVDETPVEMNRSPALLVEIIDVAFN